MKKNIDDPEKNIDKIENPIKKSRGEYQGNKEKAYNRREKNIKS